MYRIMMIPLMLIALLSVTACSSLNYPTAHKVSLGDDVGHSLSYTADLRSTHVIKKNSGYWVCMEPAPDAAFSYDDQEDLNLSLISAGEKGGGEAGKGTDDLPLAGRAAYVLLARELGYRACEIAANTNASFEQYLKLYKANLNLISTVASGESANIQNSSSIKVHTGSTSSLSFSETSTAGYSAQTDIMGQSQQPAGAAGASGQSSDSDGSDGDDDSSDGDGDSSDGDGDSSDGDDDSSDGDGDGGDSGDSSPPSD